MDVTELQSETFALPEVTFNAIQRCLERLYCEKLAKPSHLFVAQEDYDTLTEEACTHMHYRFRGYEIVEEKIVDIKKVALVANQTTGKYMKFDVSPKLAKGTFSVLYKLDEPWLAEVNSGQ